MRVKECRARQGSIGERAAVCLPWNQYHRRSKCPAAFSYSCCWPGLCKESKTPGVYLACPFRSAKTPFTVQTGNFYTTEDSLPGKGILPSRQNGAAQTAHRGQLPWEQTACTNTMGDDGKIDKGVFHRELAVRGLLFLGWQQPLLSPVLG